MSSDTDTVTNIEPETEVETEPEHDASADTDFHADPEPKRARKIDHTPSQLQTVAAGVLKINGENVGRVCAAERSSARRKRICTDTSNIDQVIIRILDEKIS